MKKRFALAFVAAGVLAAGCSSDGDDGSDPAVDTATPSSTPAGTPSSTPAMPGANAGDITTNGPEDDAGPVELAVAGNTEVSNFYTLFDAIFGGETFDGRNTPEEAWTILVPTNAAFGAGGATAIPDDDRGRFLQRHVITSGKLTLDELSAMSSVVVNAGDEYPITGDASALAIGGANLTSVLAENGNTIVYLLDAVLEETAGN